MWTSLVLGLITGSLVVPCPVQAKLYETRDEALRHVFGKTAHLERRTVYLETAQIDSVRRLAQAPFEKARITYYAATDHDTLLGHAYLETHTVRTMPETMLVAIGPGGRVIAVRVLAFHEPEDYRPPKRWLETLLGRRDPGRVRPGDDVDTVSGATLSVRAVTGAVRRALALEHVLHEKMP